MSTVKVPVYIPVETLLNQYPNIISKSDSNVFSRNKILTIPHSPGINFSDLGFKFISNSGEEFSSIDYSYQSANSYSLFLWARFTQGNDWLPNLLSTRFTGENKDKRDQYRKDLLEALKVCPTSLVHLAILQVMRARLHISLATLRECTGVTYTLRGSAREAIPTTLTFSNVGLGTLLDFVMTLWNTMNTEELSTKSTYVVKAPKKILEYSTRVPTVLPCNLDVEGIMGIELELNYKETSAKSLNFAHSVLSEFCIFKRDGSVPEGFEIVSKPEKLDQHIKHWYPFFKEVHNYFKSASNCGMHIHLNRKGLSFLQIAKLAEFMNREDNLDYIHAIAGRLENSYAKSVKTTTISSVGKIINSGKSTYGDRYATLNLSGTSTLEFRVFASTLNWTDFLTNLEFVVALKEYTTPGKVALPPVKQVQSSEFISWVNLKENRKTYPHLHTKHNSLRLEGGL
jgi:hypothetical protein